MNKHGTNETLGFNGFSGYYGQVPNGYGGFNWEDVYYSNNHKDQGGDHGYQYPIDGRGEAVLGAGENGLIESATPSDTFTLKSMLAAVGGEAGAPVLFISYAYSNGEFVQKAADWTYVGSSVQKIDFATLGDKGDFQNISGVFMLVGSHSYGAAYGHSALTFDNLKVHWNGAAPIGRGQLATPAHHVSTAHSVFENMVMTSEPAPAEHHSHPASMLDADHLAQPEHFGP